MPRIPALALAADVVAVVVFAAIGRLSHAEPDDVLGLLATAAPFLLGLGVLWLTSAVRTDPAGFRAGAAALVGTVVIGLIVRSGFTGPPPLSFVIVTTVALAVLMLGWRALSLVVARYAAQRVR